MQPRDPTLLGRVEGRHEAAPEAPKTLPQVPIGSPAFLASRGEPAVPESRALGGGLDQLLTVRKVAKALAVCPATVYALCERGELPHVRILNAIRVRCEDVRAFVAAKRKG